MLHRAELAGSEDEELAPVQVRRCDGGADQPSRVPTILRRPASKGRLRSLLWGIEGAKRNMRLIHLLPTIDGELAFTLVAEKIAALHTEALGDAMESSATIAQRW